METGSLKVLANKVLQGNRKGNPVETENKKVETLTDENGNSKKLNIDNETLSERMAIMGENCNPDQRMPFVTDSGAILNIITGRVAKAYWIH